MFSWFCSKPSEHRLVQQSVETGKCSSFQFSKWFIPPPTFHCLLCGMIPSSFPSCSAVAATFSVFVSYAHTAKKANQKLSFIGKRRFSREPRREHRDPLISRASAIFWLCITQAKWGMRDFTLVLLSVVWFGSPVCSCQRGNRAQKVLARPQVKKKRCLENQGERSRRDPPTAPWRLMW